MSIETAAPQDSARLQHPEALPERANLDDLARLEALSANAIDVRLDLGRAEPRFTLYVAGERVSLSQVLPILHSLGVEVLDERPYPIVRSDGSSAWIYDFSLRIPRTPADLPAAASLPQRFCDTFVAVWSSSAEADSFNHLVPFAGRTWAEAALLRAYAKYLRQTSFPYSAERIAAVLVEYPGIVADLVALFAAQFDPAHADPARASALADDVRAAIEDVVSLETDRILRAYLDLVRATVRTNYYRADADTLALKLEPRELVQLPQPRPRFEVFVYSPRVEGVHLRFSRVARGGLRWSDRHEDLRTEILALAKAQTVKNAVIVPGGAKGGFVVKRPPRGSATRDAINNEGIACYRAFIGALLDLTDNVDPAGAVNAPRDVVRRDGDDPYLVVAADKGTATFSDIANEIATERGFWLGDAFASGGSVGYDHKAMGITAKGAWESVKRHFRELDLDVQSQEFTVAGIGDMTGDVFGNAMLLSRHIRLVAAFDHRHIFLDPDPAAARAYRERRRLFGLPHSSWADYDADLISAGGGVWDRTAKSIPVSAAARRALGLDDGARELTPPELIRAILRAPVDLLFNGGIGTYVKAAGETHLDVGDKANDAVRVDATDVRAKVLGEGGNLGVTPAGRVEFARDGGRVNADAVDNSAGVDCSDREVNIKILLDVLVAGGRIDNNARETLLRSMTDDVERLVLADNVAQNELLGTCRATAAARLRVHGRQIRALVARRGLDRDLETLPDDDDIAQRVKRGTGLTSPELATLAAHVKLALKADLLADGLPDGAAFADRLLAYFPGRLGDEHRDAILEHRLRREIIATVVANEVVDTAGISYVFRLAEDVGVSTAEAVRAYAVASAIFKLPELMVRIRRTAPNTAVGDGMIAEVRRLLDRVSRWLLNHRPQPIAIGADIARYAPAVDQLMPRVPGWLRGPDAEIVRSRGAELVQLGADTASATAVVSLLHAFCTLDIIDVADLEDRGLDEVGELYYTLNAHLGVDHLLTAISGLDDTHRWNALARQSLRDDVYRAMRALCRDVLSGSVAGQPAAEQIAGWEAENRLRLARARAMLTEIFAASSRDLATLSVAVRQLRTMVGSTRVEPAEH